MNNKLTRILQEVISIQSGLLRFRHKDGRQNLQVKIVFGGTNSLHCIITGEVPEGMKIAGRKVHLIQKYNNDYFFISGDISREVQDTRRILSIAISKASWFVRKRKGGVTWLHEKSTYENEQQQLLAAS
ncbi:MAG: hypothetical protein WDO16_03660 [Bacteroidota bacterium]